MTFANYRVTSGEFDSGIAYNLVKRTSLDEDMKGCSGIRLPALVSALLARTLGWECEMQEINRSSLPSLRRSCGKSCDDVLGENALFGAFEKRDEVRARWLMFVICSRTTRSVLLSGMTRRHDDVGRTSALLPPFENGQSTES